MSLCLANHLDKARVKGPSIMENNVEDIIKEDEEVNVLQDQSLSKGQEDIMVDIEQWHPMAGDNGQLEERCSDGDEMKSSDDDLARCNEEKICLKITSLLEEIRANVAQ